MASTILIALMGLDIGGAETHAVVLSKCLKDKGFNIVVASNGGIYEKVLTEYGIKHYKVSLNTKRPWQVVQSFFRLINIIKSEKVDLIHAHARIPAFICNIVSKILKVRFITTAHAKFKSSFLLKLISKWGEKTIAVSDDIKKHLINKFGVKEQKITIIPNGIDTNEFADGMNYQEIVTEFGIDDSYKKIVWVSRIDDQLGDTILSLIDTMDLLYKEYEKIVLIIVGYGNRIEEIKRQAEIKNEKLGRKAIYITGKRTDINKLINFSDVFVGISRAALEAMACERPVILAGPWNFVGTINEQNISELMKDNFTGRNFKQTVTSDLIYKAVKDVLNMSSDDRLKLCRLERQIVVDNYSSVKMTDQTQNIYNSILKGEK